MLSVIRQVEGPRWWPDTRTNFDKVLKEPRGVIPEDGILHKHFCPAEGNTATASVV
jgi:hypothetical protein